MGQFYRSYKTSYWSAYHCKCSVFYHFRVIWCRRMSWLWGHWRILEITPFDRLCSNLLRHFNLLSKNNYAIFSVFNSTV